MTPFRASQAAVLALLAAGACGCELNPEGGMGGDDPGTGGNASLGGSGGSPAGSGGSGSPGGSGGSSALGGNGGDAGSSTSGAGGQDVTPGPIWTSASDAIEVWWFSFFGGGAKFAKTREELTAEELAIVELMATIADNDSCVSDGPEASVTVETDGVLDSYYASYFGGACGRDVRLIAYEPVGALFSLLGCKTAKGYDGSTLETAPTITPGDGCYHGIFNASTTTPEWWFVLTVPEAGTVRVMLDSCGDRDLELTLFDETGETPLASTTSANTAAGAECPELAHEVEAGNYAVYVDMRAGTNAGDFFLRADSGT